MSARRILVSHPWGIVLRKAIVTLEPPKYWRRRPINGKECILKTKIQAYKGFQVLSGLNCVIARALGIGELLRILQQRVALRVTQVVLTLCIHVGAAHLDDRALVAPRCAG
jgi:hypothetical protein